MEIQKPTYDSFLLDVAPQNRLFVDATHAFLLENGCKTRVQLAKSGYVVSYDHAGSKRVIANYVFRRKGMLMRLYADHVGAYEDQLQALPESMRKAIAKSPTCKRLIDPTRCSPHCRMGNTFTLDGEEHKKCRFTNFLLLVDEESQPYLRGLLEREMAARG
ncbi:hypothetical protein LJC74_07020 [Eubacteriales bacterium OttesenSCG-928-A19]|nr:hypothetical protein [Eubacteriales bacterium OttesenSCG-928-A19]